MKGEIGLKVKKISILNPCFSEAVGETYHELRIDEENGNFLYIVGDNNMADLLQSALHEYYKNKKKRGIK